MDEEAWRGENEWNSPDRIATCEYSSFIESLYDQILRPVVHGRQRIDRDVLEMVHSELEWKIKEKGFGDLPFNIRNAYESLNKFMIALKESDDVEIEQHRGLLEGNFLLGISCNVYGRDLKIFNKGRNPCRQSQITMYSALAKARRCAEEGVVSLPIVEASGQLFDVCKKCPYR